MKEVTERYAREKEFHDKAFAESVRDKADKYYSIFASCRKVMVDFLSENCEGKKVLEYGCGEGSFAFYLSRNGAKVTGIDISPVAIENAAARAQYENLKETEFIEMNAEALKFAPDSFDVICGTAIIHHLDINSAYAELARVLKPNGQAIFMEPLGHNKIIDLYRKLTPSMRTVDEHPLFLSDIKKLDSYFSKIRVEYFYLLSLLAVPFRNTIIFKGMLKTLEKIDNFIFSLFPFFRRYAWYVVIKISEPKK